jgi:hypothetical protein
MDSWKDRLHSDPVPWLLEESHPAVRHATLVSLLERPEDDTEARASRSAAMTADPIASILAAQQLDGYWIRPGLGYQKYRGTVWQIIILDQMAADGAHPQVQAVCEYLLRRVWEPHPGERTFYNGADGRPYMSRLHHCLAGNLLRALLGFGWLEDERVQRAIEWQARAVTGEDIVYQPGDYTTGPGFQCRAHWGQPCAWGAVKALLAFARIPTPARSPLVQRAMQASADFLLSRDLAASDYPIGQRSLQPSPLWHKLGFPVGYHADVLQNLEALCETGYAQDERLRPAIEWVLARQDRQGRWKNRNSYHAKMWVDIEKQGAPSKWVTLRACRMLKKVYG